MNVAQKNNRSVRSRYELNVTVECLTLRTYRVLTQEALSRFSSARTRP